MIWLALLLVAILFAILFPNGMKIVVALVILVISLGLLYASFVGITGTISRNQASQEVVSGWQVRPQAEQQVEKPRRVLSQEEQKALYRKYKKPE